MKRKGTLMQYYALVAQEGLERSSFSKSEPMAISFTKAILEASIQREKRLRKRVELVNGSFQEVARRRQTKVPQLARSENSWRRLGLP